jgi:methyl-accepting chemotaxis protein
MRAAEASKNTADLIEDTVKRVKDGSELLEKTNAAFSKVAGSSGKVGELVDEIAAASSEQAEGIEQINLAAGEMDKIVQQNAANAEESASASEEMSAQAMQMRQFVADLLAVVGGSGNGNSHHITITEQSPKTDEFPLAPAIKARKLETTGRGAGIVKPELVIPMEDQDFKDF